MAAAGLDALHAALPHLEIVTRDARPSDAYDKLVTTWSKPLGFSFWPLAVLRPDSVADICTIISLLRARSLPFTIRSGGHDWWARSIGPVPDAFIVDIRNLNSIRFNDQDASASIGGGVTQHEVARALFKFGRIALVGGCPSVGYISWACTGGFGMQSPSLGLGVDQVLGVTMVTAEGEVIEADEELLWAIRGAGTSFGVIVEMRIRTYPASMTLSGSVGFPAAEAETILKGYLDSPLYEECGGHVLFTAAPGVGEVIIITVSWRGISEEALKYANRLRNLGTVIYDNLREMSMLEMMDNMDALTTPPCPLTTITRTLWFPELTSEIIPIILKSARSKPASGQIGIHHIHHMGNSTPYKNQSCFGGRQAHFMVELVNTFPTSDQVQDPTASSWVNSVWHELKPLALRGGYTALMSPDQDFSESYSVEDWSRLLSLKRRYDGSNTFKFGIPDFAPAL